MLAKFKNIIILFMSFNPDVVTGTIGNIKFTASIQTDNKGQYIVVRDQKYYLSKFKVC